MDPITRLNAAPGAAVHARRGGQATKGLLALLVSLTALAACDSAPNPIEPVDPVDWAPLGPNILNLGFEQVTPDSKPKRWFTGDEGYEVDVVATPVYEGTRSLRLAHRAGDGFGVATQMFPLEDALGKRLKFIGYIRTEDITTGWAGLWMRVDGPNGQMLEFDNMNGRGLTGTTDWRRVEISLPVASNAEDIFFGALLTNDGAAWFDAFWFEVDGAPYQPPFLFDADAAQHAWLEQNLEKFDTEEPGSGFGDLTFLTEMVGSAHIVSLGEGTHGTSEFFKMKHRITEFLANEMGFTVFAIEANMPESRAINRYVLYGEGDPRDALDGIYFWTWNTQEVLDMIEWMRSFNASGQGQIQFFGFDAQTPTVAATNVETFLDEVEPSYSDSARVSYAVVRSVHQDRRDSYRDPTIVVDQEAWTAAARKVLTHLESRRTDYLASKPEADVDWAIQDARVVLQSADPRLRDRSMAENVDWILEHSPVGTKIVLWAHNAHVQDRPRWMGGYLRNTYGTGMGVFGFAFHEGEYTAVGSSGLGTYTTSASDVGSAEWVFHSTGVARFMLDLRLASPDDPSSNWLTRPLDFRSIGALARSYAFSQTVLTDDFDVVVFFDRSTPSLLLSQPMAGLMPNR